MSYKISEIFYSIQSEGFFSGTPANFIRFFGCNLDCNFCDEPLHKEINNLYTLKELKENINKDCKHIVITGGEPSLYNLILLIDELKRDGYFIQIETNGYKLENIKNADYITVSPKDCIKKDDKINEYKFIFGSDIKIQDIIQLSKSNRVYLQPMAEGDHINNESTKKAIQAVLNNPTLNLSLQTHKYLRIQ